MLLKKFLKKMQHLSNRLDRLVSNGVSNFSADYDNAIKALNTLQSNAEYIKAAEKQKLTHNEEYLKTIVEIEKYFARAGFTLETLDTIPVIHVAGTKGKGTTCALCESILRHHGLKTGFYSSPHLFEVRERIRINGKSIQKQEFAKHFWNLFNLLDKQKENPYDMPMYFKFLTIMAFKVFLFEKVDVAIIEVGIGGEYDSTNILRSVPVVGITSLGLDHTNMLGETIEQIAWHKAGIMKPNSQAFTVPQSPSAFKVLQNRSVERNCALKTVEPISNLVTPQSNGGPKEIYQLNTSLATVLAQTWMNRSGKFLNPEKTALGILECKWPGRYQLLRMANNYYLDGAHTLESIEVCTEWFIQKTKRSPYKKVLLFNSTGVRNSEDFLKKLKSCNFDLVFFVPNKATTNDTEDNKNFHLNDSEQMDRCKVHQKLWLQNSSNNNQQLVHVLPSVFDAFFQCNSQKHEILITGSLYLVGAALSLLDPELRNSEISDR